MDGASNPSAGVLPCWFYPYRRKAWDTRCRSGAPAPLMRMPNVCSDCTRGQATQRQPLLSRHPDASGEPGRNVPCATQVLVHGKANNRAERAAGSLFTQTGGRTPWRSLAEVESGRHPHGQAACAARSRSAGRAGVARVRHARGGRGGRRSRPVVRWVPRSMVPRVLPSSPDRGGLTSGATRFSLFFWIWQLFLAR